MCEIVFAIGNGLPGSGRAAGKQDTRVVACTCTLSSAYSSSPSRQSQAKTGMRKGLKKAKAKVGQLFSPSRSGSRSQTPAPPESGPVQLAPFSSEKSTTKDDRPSQVTEAEPTTSMLLAQITVAQAPTHLDLDHDPVPPARPPKRQLPQSTSGESAEVESARRVSDESLRHVVVCTMHAVLFRRSNLSQMISNNNQITTYNYGGQVLNYNPIINVIYLTKKEVWHL